LNVFWIIAALMTAAALYAVLRPLLRRGDGDPRLSALDAAHRAGVLDEREYASKRAALSANVAAPAAQSSRALTLGLALLVPLATFGIYRQIGDLRALDPTMMAAAAVATHAATTDAQAPDMDQAVAGLAAKMAQNPDDVEGWVLLGRAYKQMQRFTESRDALAKAIALAPEQPDVMVEYAEAMAMAGPERRIEGEPRALLEKALAANPQHERALWLLGISDAQAGDAAGAVRRWETLLPLLPPDSDVAKSVGEQIAQARAEAGLAPGAAAPAPGAAAPASVPAIAAAATAATAAGPKLVVRVDVAPELKGRIQPGDTLFVFARMPEGPRMPLAIQRRQADSLPITVTLDDSMGMLPTMKLSSAPQVVVGARISRSGNATPQAGDFQGLSAPLTVAGNEGVVELLISEIVP
jgi:cytochrome c-type biogenesis protein CcmH